MMHYATQLTIHLIQILYACIHTRSSSGSLLILINFFCNTGIHTLSTFSHELYQT